MVSKVRVLLRSLRLSSASKDKSRARQADGCEPALHDDILYLIAAFLPMKTLKNFSLASRSTRAAALPMLFRRLKLPSDLKERELRSLLKIHQDNPSLRVHTRVLCVQSFRLDVYRTLFEIFTNLKAVHLHYEHGFLMDLSARARRGRWRLGSSSRYEFSPAEFVKALWPAADTLEHLRVTVGGRAGKVPCPAASSPPRCKACHDKFVLRHQEKIASGSLASLKKLRRLDGPVRFFTAYPAEGPVCLPELPASLKELYLTPDSWAKRGEGIDGYRFATSPRYYLLKHGGQVPALKKIVFDVDCYREHGLGDGWNKGMCEMIRLCRSLNITMGITACGRQAYWKPERSVKAT